MAWRTPSAGMRVGRTRAGARPARRHGTEHRGTRRRGEPDLSTLLRAEIDLAKAEITDEAKTAAKGGAMFGGAAFLGLLAVILLSIAWPTAWSHSVSGRGWRS